MRKGRTRQLLQEPLRRLIDVRKRTPEVAGVRLRPFSTNNLHVRGYQRPGLLGGEELTVAAFADFAGPQEVSDRKLSGLPASALELISGEQAILDGGLAIDLSASADLAPSCC